jgi:hypothetical protein
MEHTGISCHWNAQDCLSFKKMNCLLSDDQLQSFL